MSQPNALWVRFTVENEKLMEIYINASQNEIVYVYVFVLVSWLRMQVINLKWWKIKEKKADLSMVGSTMAIWEIPQWKFINLNETYLIELVKSTNLIESFFCVAQQSASTMNYVKLFYSIYVMSMLLRAMRSINMGCRFRWGNVIDFRIFARRSTFQTNCLVIFLRPRWAPRKRAIRAII